MPLIFLEGSTFKCSFMKNKNVMDEQLEKVRKAYDLTVEQYNQGLDPLQDVPEEIRNSTFYESLVAEGNAYNSSAADIKDYLAPETGMRFLDVGCAANLVNYRLNRWPSTYYGVDISPALIKTMKGFVVNQKISIGGLYVADMTRLPFEDNFFDIAAVIGVLEYCTLVYMGKALVELHRVLKPGSRVVLDMPNRNHPHVNDMVKLEEYLNRPNFIHSRSEFEVLLEPLFIIDRLDDSRVMLKYFVRKRKRRLG